MKKLLICAVLAIIFSCSKSGDRLTEDAQTIVQPGNSAPCGTHNGKTLHKGPRGGCYYINSNGNKTYVDRNECNC